MAEAQDYINASSLDIMVIKLGYTTSIFEGARAIVNSEQVAMDFIMCLCGDRISSGCFRDVYEHATDPSKVIKIEYGHERKTEHGTGIDNTFCNVQEFLMWREIEGLKGKLEWVKKWFAPIHWISPSGHVLCMQKTTPQPKRKRPDEIPAFLWDVKQENFGWIGNNLVCHDYAHIPAFTTYRKKMRKVKDIWI